MDQKIWDSPEDKRIINSKNQRRLIVEEIQKFARVHLDSGRIEMEEEEEMSEDIHEHNLMDIELDKKSSTEDMDP